MNNYWMAFAKNGAPDVTGQPPWPRYSADGAYMAFARAAESRHELLPGMFELNEQVVCRRRAQGGIPWNWNVGILAPPLPVEVSGCR